MKLFTVSLFLTTLLASCSSSSRSKFDSRALSSLDASPSDDSVAISMLTPENGKLMPKTYQISCEDEPAQIASIQANDKMVEEEMAKFKSFFEANPDRKIKTASLGYYLTFKQIAENLILDHTLIRIEGDGKGTTLWTFANLANGYNSKFFGSLYREAGVDRARIVTSTSFSEKCRATPIKL